MANPSLQIGNSNWAIKEDNLLGYSTAGTRFVPQPITMTRASAGTRVNSSGLVETVELLGSELVVNGDFSNGLSDWGNSNVSLVSGGANLNNIGLSGANTYIRQSNLIAGKYYKLELDVIDTNGADLVLEQASNTSIEAQTTGHKIVYFTQGASSSIVIKRLSGDTNVVIDNISVKEVTKNNLARVDYDGTASSLLAEPQRTNLITYSEDFSQWSVNQLTIEPNATTSPDGTLNASRMTPTTTSSVHLIATSGSTTMAISVYAKSNGYHRFRLNSGSSGNGYASFDLNAGTVLNSGGTYYTSSSIDSVGDGWYRCTLVLTSGVASVPNLAIEDNSGNVSFIGDGTSAIYVWGGQAEVGSYATSYIPTDGGTVTRLQDQYSKTGISNLINSEEGVLFVEMALFSDEDSNKYMSISDGTHDNKIQIDFDYSSSRLQYVVKSGTAVQVNLKLSYTGTNMDKIAVKWKVNDFAVWLNGVEIGTDTSGLSPIGLNTLNFSSSGSNHFQGKVKQLQVFKTALTDPELVTLTTI